MLLKTIKVKIYKSCVTRLKTEKFLQWHIWDGLNRKYIVNMKSHGKM